MDSLDLSTHQHILSELATVLADQAARGKPANQHLSVFAPPPALERKQLSLADVRTQIGLGDFCSALATTGGAANLAELQPVLTDLRKLLAQLVDTAIEESMAWHGWAPADQLVYSLVMTLLRVGRLIESEREASVEAVLTFTRQLVVKLAAPAGDAHAAVTRHVPFLHGLYRGIAGSAFHWKAEEFSAMSKAIQPLGAAAQVLRNLNDILIVLPEQDTAFDQAICTTRRRAKPSNGDTESIDTLLTDSDVESLTHDDETAFRDRADEEAFEYRASLLAFYVRAHRPLSGQFVLAAGIEILSSILAQFLAGYATSSEGGIEPQVVPDQVDQVQPKLKHDTTATQNAWTKLMRHPVGKFKDAALVEGLNATLRLASNAYRDTFRFVLAEQVKDHGEIAVELYSLEILSESLKLGVLCTVGQTRSDSARTEVDTDVFVRVRALLSEQAKIYEPILQAAALQSTGVLVMNFDSLVMPMTSQLRRFVTTPLTMFEPMAGEEDLVPAILITAAKALRACVTAHGNQDLVVSTVYTLLNYLGRDTGFVSSGGSVRSGHSRATTARDERLAGRTDEQKASITANTIAVVARLALEVGTIEVISLTLSMLLQRLRAADGFSEGLIMINIVPLAIAGTKHSFVEVVRAFSNVLRSSMAGGIQRRDSEAAHVAMFKLAQSLKHRRETVEAKASGTADSAAAAETDIGCKELYLTELLQLFAEKGKQLQGAGSQRTSNEELGELRLELARLVPTIAELLRHDDLNPQLAPTLEMVSLFRNMWFLAVLFNLANPKVARRASHEIAQTGSALILTTQSVVNPAAFMHKALALVALKTPTLVPETAHNYLETELEFNSVLKRDFGSTAVEAQRQLLTQIIPTQAQAIRSFKLPQVIFLLTIYNVEIIRSSLGRPSMLLWYFVNDGLNSSSLVSSMDAMADKVIQEFIHDLRPQMADHSVDSRVTDEVQNLLVGTVHRVAKVRQVSSKFLNALLGAYPTLLCDPKLVILILEMLTLLRRACETEFTDEYAPVYHFSSTRANVGFDLSDDYPQREEILRHFLRQTRVYIQNVLRLAPVEVKSILESYLSDPEYHSGSFTELGKSVAADFARSAGVGNRQESFLPSLGGWSADSSSALFADVTAKSNYTGEVTGIHLALTRKLAELKEEPTADFSEATIANIKAQLVTVAKAKEGANTSEVRRLLYRTAALAVALPYIDFDLLHYVVSIPVRIFDPKIIMTASHAWSWIISERPATESKIMTELALAWNWTVQNRSGLFSPKLTSKHPFFEKTEMSAFDRNLINAEATTAKQLFEPHLILIRLLTSRYQAFQTRDPAMALTVARLLDSTTRATPLMSTHPLSRELRFLLVNFGLRVLQSSKLDVLLENHLRLGVYKLAFGWFAASPRWSFGSNRLQVRAETQLLQEVLALLNRDRPAAVESLTSFPADPAYIRLGGHVTVQQAIRKAGEQRQVLVLLIENELHRYSVWSNPMHASERGADFTGPTTSKMTDGAWLTAIRVAWEAYPAVVVHMPHRFQVSVVVQEAGRLVRAEPWRAVDVAEALPLLTDNFLQSALREKTDLNWLLYWKPVTPVEAIELFQPKYGNNPLLFQYAMKTLKHHPVDLTFFYVPQIVQALRSDPFGYVEQFIFEQSKISQLFCHQIIWNMRANSYKDDEGEIEDSLKPTLDRMVDSIVAHLSGEAQDFYEREFSFFNEVTDISGKLKPYIKKSKAEKKAKIDEEMAKIKVDEGVYLPSNPDGAVIDLARKSGRPLQSHAKAPFMATFKVRREVAKPGAALDENGKIPTIPKDVWQSAIFKVGDDCRQDVLALQIIAMFKNIFTNAGLDLYLNPYRVTATGPGTGVIDVVPNATSRDEMGRAQVNDLYAWFLSTFGNVDSIAFQKARINFIQSMAGYSLASYIAQVRDRHNGNIMIDGEGHLVHIDFGFLFDIGPGGMRFEPDSFKLTAEMIDVMGGGKSQGFKLFCELVVKGFLAIREYAEDVISICHLMLPTDLPSFKGEPTIGRLRDRFKLDLTPREAARYAEGLIQDAYKNNRSVAYDGLQYVQNGIPSRPN